MSLSWFVKFWLLPTFILLGLCRLLILTVAFKHLATLLGESWGISPWIPVLSKYNEIRAAEIAQVIRIAAQYTPWESTCFPQAMTARLMLGLYNIPYSLFFGLNNTQEPQGLQAHAWVATGRVRVTGGASFRQYTVVHCFSSINTTGIDRS